MRRLTVVRGGVAVVVPWSQLAWKGHGDDALVLLGTALVIRSLAAGSRNGQWLGLAVALLGKPTAVVLLPTFVVSLPAEVGAAVITAVISAPLHARRSVGSCTPGTSLMTAAPAACQRSAHITANATCVHPAQLRAARPLAT